MTEKMTELQLAMIGEYQCPGCTCGSAPPKDCESFEAECGESFRCVGHSAGTLISGVGWVCLGLPKGFDRVGQIATKHDKEVRTNIRLWVEPNKPGWDRFNVPVWAMVVGSFLFVRTYLPRTNRNFVDVIKGGTIDCLPPGVVDVGEFCGEID